MDGLTKMTLEELQAEMLRLRNKLNELRRTAEMSPGGWWSVATQQGWQVAKNSAEQRLDAVNDRIAELNALAKLGEYSNF